MKKIDKTVISETKYIGIFSVILSLLMQGVFLVVCSLTKLEWSYNIITGNLLGLVCTVGNFFLMGIGVQKAVAKEEKGAKDTLKLSQTLRMFGILVMSVLAVTLKCFNPFAFFITLFFPRIAIQFRPMFDKKMN